MCKTNFFNFDIYCDCVSKKSQRLVGEFVVGHVDLLQVPHLDEVVDKRTDLRVREHTFYQVEALDWHNLQ